MMVTRLVLVASVILLVLGDETSQMRDELVPAKDLRSNDKDNLNSDRRQSRLSRQTELPSSKTKREQVLRNFLAARKRQFSPRPPDTTKDLINSTRNFKSPARNISKDLPDMLEAQETRHGVAITVAADDQSSSTPADTEKESENAITTKKSTAENTAIVRRESLAVRNQKNSEIDNTRRKNIVPMSESVYNHFRPVESNIPVEDMTQFLYFGQKIQPENTTGNNSVEITTPTYSRRRFFVKNGPTTPPIGRLEEIMNEEMNVAVKKMTVEKNKIPKTKNIVRSTSLYFRKIPQSIKTSESNIIIVNRTSDQSAHAQDQVDQRTTYASQRINVSTQIPREPHQRSVAARGNETESENLDSDVVTSTISVNEDDLDYQNDSNQPTNLEKALRNSAGSKKNQSATMMMDHSLEEVKKTQDQRPEMSAKSVQLTGESITPLQTTPAAQEKLSRISTWLSLSADPLSSTATTINWSSTTPVSRPQTLRIVVTEAALIDEKYQSTARPSDSTVVQVNLSSVAPTLPRPDTPVTQQMHPYAYTITNVTRLLGNYSGPGSNDRTTTEAVGSSFPPLSGAALEALEPARTPDPVSVSPAVVETTSVSSPPPPSSTLALVGGERGRKGTSLRVVERNTSVHLESLTTVISSSTTTDRNFEKSSTLRWNPPRTVADDTDREVVSERRYLKKSASAVLNQRVDDTLRELKRRRIDAARRIKGLRSEDKVSQVKAHSVEHEVIEMLVNKSLVIESSKTLDNQTLSDNVTQTQMKKLKMINELQVDRSSVAISDNDRLNFTANSTVDNLAFIVNNSTNMMTAQPVIESTSGPVTASTKRPVPVFPVTPIMFDSSNRVTKGAEEDKEHTRKKVESTQTTIQPQNKSLEITKDLVAPEVQKLLDSEVKSMPPKMERKPAPERSPEVRGRNLSDKSKDKDDVLPIMHLYNTSDIFNGTLKDNEASVAVTLVPEVSGVEPLQVQAPSSDALGQKPIDDVPFDSYHRVSDSKEGRTSVPTKTNKNRQEINREAMQNSTYRTANASASVNRTKYRPIYYSGPPESSGYHPDVNRTVFQDDGIISVNIGESINISEVITKRHDGDTLATQETVAVVSYILATLVVFPIAVGVGLILRRLIIRNRKVLEESDTSSEISCRKDALNLENGDFKTSIEKAITKLPRIQHLCHEAEKPPPPSPPESRWEFPRDKLRLQTVLGQGNFGQVWKAEADDLTGHKGTTRLVAVKTVKEGSSAREKEDLVRELEIMQQLGNHPNVVTLLGCCTDEEPHYLILEYVMYGKLLAYLRDHRTRQDFYNFSEDSAALTSRDLTVFGYCVARGMEYLASKKIIHRDLAARNVLVDHNKLCKIADFGMSRFANEDGECIETRHGRNALPIRWMAPESLIYSLFTTKTDVWSFGILMWEIVTLGSTPYPDMAAREVMRNVQDGYRLERPSHCRSELFRVIARCWHADPDRRPEFQTLRRDLAQLLEDNMNGHYVDLESFASECAD